MLRFVVLCTVVVVAFGCDRSPPARVARPAVARRAAPPRRPSVVLVTLDTTRADRLPSYGYGLGRTPTLDAIAAEGVVVEHAVAVAPLTAPSHASMLTGLYPGAHGVRDNGSYRLAEAHRTVAEAFRDGGYATFAFVSAFVLDRRYGLDQGFDVYDDDLSDEADPALFMIRERNGARTVALALAKLREHQAAHPSQPFFVWVHLFDVHQPHQAPWSDRVRTATPYDAEIAQVDRHVGALVAGLRELGVYDRTALVVTADHGESLGDHGEATHGYFAYESTMHVPLYVRAPFRLPSGYVHHATTSGTDIAPSLLDLAGLPPLDDIAGRSFVGDAAARRTPASRVVFSEAKLTELGFGMAPLYVARDERFTFVRAPRQELYDRRADPFELVPRLDAMPGEVRRLDGALDGWFAQNRERSRGETRTVVDAQTLDALRALGYVGDVAPGAAPVPDAVADEEGDAGALVDPKDGLAAHEGLETARNAAQAGDWARAREFADGALAANPRNVSALNVRALASTRLGELASARRDYTRSLELVAEQPRVETMLGQLAVVEHDPRRAIAHLDRAIAAMPGLIDAHLARADALRALHRDAEADASLERLLAAGIEVPRIQRMLGQVAFARGDYAAAVRWFRAQLAAQPRASVAHHALALALHRSNEDEEALAEADRAIALRDDVWTYAYDRACILAKLGRVDEAIASLERARERGFEDPRLLASDEDLQALRSDARFTRLVRALARPGAAPHGAPPATSMRPR